MKEVNLLDFIQTLEQIIGIDAIKSFESMQLGDVHKTLANTSLIKDWVGFIPRTDLKYGLQKFIERLVQYYEIVIICENDANPEVFMGVDPNSYCIKLGATLMEKRGDIFLKRLDLMNRDLSRIILIDSFTVRELFVPRFIILILSSK